MTRWKIIVVALWLGGGVFLMAVAAPSAFRFAPDSLVAGTIVGAMLAKWRYASIFAPLVLLIAEWRRERLQRTAPVLVLVAAVMLASLQIFTDMKVHEMRAASPVAIGSLSKSDPVRKRFGMLHGISSSLMLAQLLLAAGYVAAAGRKGTGD